jgi:hypothetical protein
MAFPGGPLPSPYPDRRINLPPEIDGRASYRGVEEGVYLLSSVILVVVV